MNDTKISVQELKNIAKKFIQERDWEQFHNPKDLSMNLAIEAGELMEKFLWISQKASLEEINGKNKQEITDELADVFFSVLCFCNATNIDLTTAFLQKIAKIAEKYPVEKAKGQHAKYDKL